MQTSNKKNRVKANFLRKEKHNICHQGIGR